MNEQLRKWEDRYAHRETPWDTGRPSLEMCRLLAEGFLSAPNRLLELGCGTGTNSVYLVQHGFAVTAVDISPLAIEQAKRRAAEAGVTIDFLAADVFDLPDLGPPFPVVFDRGLYHVVRQVSRSGILDVLGRVVAPGGIYIALCGNADDPQPAEAGPPRISAAELLDDFLPQFELLQLRRFFFDGEPIPGMTAPPMAWSSAWRRRM